MHNYEGSSGHLNMYSEVSRTDYFRRYNKTPKPGLELRGGQWGLGHIRIEIFEKLVTLEISKNSVYKAIFSSF